MHANTKVKWLGSLLALCLIAIAAESYYLWSVTRSSSNHSFGNNSLTFSTQQPQASNQWPDNWNPGTQFRQMQQQMNALMQQMSATTSMFNQQGFGISSASPRISMQDEAHQYKVTVDVPKGQKVEINTDVSGNQLTIDGKVKQSRVHQSHGSQAQALSIARFSQTLDFPGPVKDSGVKVVRNDNQIVITVPKVG